MIDVHCHLDHIPVDPKAIIQQAREAGMAAIITSVADPAHLGDALALRRGNEDFIHVAAGYHPNEIPEYTQEYANRYIETLRGLRYEIIAIGEVGLEYRGNYDSVKQQSIFSQFIDLAIEMEKPLVIHCRDAWPDTIKLLLEKKAPRVVFHCYSGSEGITKVILGQPEWYISFATNICFTKKHPRLASLVPLNRMLLDTDSPWLDPNQPPGTEQTLTNRPWKIVESARKISEIKQIPAEEVLRITAETAKRVFAI